MKNEKLSVKAAAAALNGVIGLKDTAVVTAANTTGDLESLTTVMDAEAIVGYDEEALATGMAAATTAVSIAGKYDTSNSMVPIEEGMKMIPDLESSNYLLANNLDLEYFDGKNPDILKPFAFALGANTVAGDAGLSLMFPTVNVPANVEGVVLSLVRGIVKTKFKRNDPSITGNTNFNSQSVLDGLRNPNVVRSDANLLVPVNNATSADLLDQDFKNDAYTHPTTGETIATAPILFGASKFDLTTISHTAKLVSEGVFSDETSLDVGGHIQAVYGKIGDDLFKFDVSTLPMNEITAGPSGDSQDLIVNISTENFTINPDKIKMFDGADSPELGAIPAGLSLVYGIDINGNGNMETCDFGVRTPTVTLLKVIDVNGKSVPVDAGDGKTAYDIGVKLELQSYDLRQTVTNADLKVIANVIDVSEIGQRVGIPYGAVDSYEKTILTDKKPQRAEALLSIATIRAITRTKDLQVRAIKDAVRDAATDVNGGNTKTITSAVLNPYYEVESLDLAASLDSEMHNQREEDISGLLSVKIKSILSALLYDTNYAALSTVYGKNKPAIGITYGTDLLPFMPSELELPGVIVKMAMTDVEEFKSDIYVYPIDPDHNVSSKEISPLSLGVTLVKPAIVVTGMFNKIQGTFVVPRTRVAPICSILHKFEVTNIATAMNKITSDVSQ